MFIKQKKIIFILAIFLFAFLKEADAQSVVTIYQGAISIIRPDGVIIPIAKGDVVPKILPGSIIDVMEGSIEAAPAENFIKVAAVDSIALIKARDRVTISIHPRIQMVEFHSIAGNIDIITGNLKTSLITGQKVRIGLDKYTNIVYVQSIDGNTTSFIAGSRILILQNSGIQIKLDPMSLKTTITVTAGTVNITSIDGTRHILNHNESINIQGIGVKPQFEDSPLPKTVAEAAAEGIKTVEQAAAEYADGTAIEGTASAEETGYSAEADDDFNFFMDQPSEMPSEPEIVEASPYLP